jgi:hypothetical protein
MKTIRELREAAPRLSITLDWDIDADGELDVYSGDWADAGVWIDKHDKRKEELTVVGTKKDLMKWLVNEMGMNKRMAQIELKQGKRVKV